VTKFPELPEDPQKVKKLSQTLVGYYRTKLPKLADLKKTSLATSAILMELAEVCNLGEATLAAPLTRLMAAMLPYDRMGVYRNNNPSYRVIDHTQHKAIEEFSRAMKLDPATMTNWIGVSCKPQLPILISKRKVSKLDYKSLQDKIKAQ